MQSVLARPIETFWFRNSTMDCFPVNLPRFITDCRLWCECVPLLFLGKITCSVVPVQNVNLKLGTQMWRQVKMRKILWKRTLDNNLILHFYCKVFKRDYTLFKQHQISAGSFALFRDWTHRQIIWSDYTIKKVKHGSYHPSIPNKAETLPKH